MTIQGLGFSSVGQNQGLLLQAAKPTAARTVSLTPVSPALYFAGDTSTQRRKTLRDRLATALLIATTTLGAPLGLASSATAQTGQAGSGRNRADKVLAWASKPWKEGKAFKDFKVQDWNNTIVGLRVTDDTQELAFQTIRAKILQEGATNPFIPAEVLREAIITAGILGSKTSDPKLKAEIAQLVGHYTDKVIVDSLNEKGEKIRDFEVIGPKASSEEDGEESIFSSGSSQRSNFTERARIALARTADPQMLKSLQQALLAAGNNPERIAPYFAILKNIAPGVKLPQTPNTPPLEQKMLEWIYSSKSLAEEKKDPAPKTESAKTPKELIDSIKDKDTQALAKLLTGNAKSESAKPADEKAGFICDAPPDALEALDKKLLIPKLPCVTDEKRQQLTGESVQFLARRNPEKLLSAISQSLARRDYTQGEDLSLDKPGDLELLEGLGVLAQNPAQPLAFDLLKRTIASYPEEMGQLLMQGARANAEVKPSYKAGVEMLKALNANRPEARKLIQALADRQAKLLWKDPTKEEVQTKFEDLRDAGRQLGVLMMMSDYEGLKKGLHLETLRKIATDQYDQDLQLPAIAGLAFARDTKSIPLLLSIGRNKLVDKNISSLALNAVQYILSEPDLLPEVEARAAREQMFLFDGPSQFVEIKGAKKSEKPGQAQKAGVRINPKVNPFMNRVAAQIQKWENQVKQLSKLAEEHGRPPISIQTEDRLLQLMSAMKAELGGSARQAQLLKGNDEAFAAMLDYLQTTPRAQMDVGKAIAMIDLMGRAQYKPAAPLLAKIAQAPEKFVPEVRSGDIFELLFGSMVPAILKIYTVEALGLTTDAGSKDAKILRDILKDPFLPFQLAGLRGLNGMGSRGTNPEQAKAVIAYIQQLNQGNTDATQRLRLRKLLQFEAARVADRLGGTAELIQLANSEMKQNPRSEVAKNVLQALITNGRSKEESAKAGLDPKVYDWLAGKQYWLGNLHQRGFKGEGGEHAHFDVGHVNPIGGNKGKIEWPKWLRWSDLNNWLEPHPTGTSDDVGRIAPGMKKIHSYNVAESYPFSSHDSMLDQDGLFKGLEDLIQKQIKGETNVTTTNHSYGYFNFLMYSPDIRNKLLDLMSAYLEALGETGVLNFVSAGNGQGGGPLEQYDRIGTQGSLGSRIDEDGKVSKSKSTVLVSAVDGVTEKLAEFSSVPNPLRREEALPMLGAPGRGEMSWYKNGLREGEWEQLPVDGTSFSSPNLAGLVQVAIQARAKAGLKPLDKEAMTLLLNQAAAPVANREEWESGRYVNPEKFIELALKQ